MSRILQALADRDAHIWTLRMVVLLQTVVTVLMYFAWHTARQEITVHIPPDLSRSVHQAAAEIPEPNIYAFALMVYQSLNLWQDSGTEDYPRQITDNRCYLTPRFIRWLEDNMRHKQGRGELARSRAVFPLAGYLEDSVEPQGDGSWIVILNLGLSEWVRNRRIKDTAVRYRLKVVSFDVSRDCNPWGLALDRHLDVPRRISG